MRIFYGVAGEGNGHYTRSKTVIEHLQRSGHTVLVGASKQAFRFLHKRVPTVQIRGLQIKYQDGGMNIPGSIALNIAAAPTMLQDNLAAASQIDRFAPQVTITDLEPFAYYYAKTRGIPVISIDNHQVMPRCVHAKSVIDTNPVGFALVSSFVDNLMPYCDHYVVTSFFRPEISATNTTLVSPVLRSEILQASQLAQQRALAPHVLVYQTDKSGAQAMFDTLRKVPQNFVVYGVKSPGETTETRGNCIIKSFDESQFVKDLAESHAVVSNGGYSLLSEAVALQKPIFSVPLQHHAEQIFNASCISQLGYGVNAARFDSEALTDFLRRSYQYKTRLCSLPQHDNNGALYNTLNRLFSGN